MDICEQIGIDRNMAQKIIKEQQFTEELVLDRYEAQQLQISSVPFLSLKTITVLEEWSRWRYL